MKPHGPFSGLPCLAMTSEAQTEVAMIVIGTAYSDWTRTIPDLPLW